MMNYYPAKVFEFKMLIMEFLTHGLSAGKKLLHHCTELNNVTNTLYIMYYLFGHDLRSHSWTCIYMVAFTTQLRC